MRLIIKDYLLQLKEKDELDLLLCDLLLQKGYNADNIPRTGNRQYGVDIQAHKEHELLLCVIKQGDIDRKTWNDGPNSVRQSIDEIFDVYLNLLQPSEQKKRIRIIVATNGVLDEAVKKNWNGYVSNHRKWQDKTIDIEFWGIDDITDYVQKYLFDEHLFPTEMQKNLRKALYFVEEPDYKNVFFEQIIDHYITSFQKLLDLELSSIRKKKQFQKEVTSLYLATQMIAQYAANSKRYKLGIMITEYLLIRYWKFLFDRNLFEKNIYCEWLIKFCYAYENWSRQYYEEVKEYCEKEGAFPKFNNIVEQRLMLYEIIGFLSTYAFYECYVSKKGTYQVLDTIVALINNHPQFLYTPYDSNVCQITILYRLLIETRRKKDVLFLLDYQASVLMKYYQLFKKYPTPADTFRDAIDIELGNEHEDYETSGLWGYFLLWIAALDGQEVYDSVKEFLYKELGHVTKCAWFLRENEEKDFYNPYVMYIAGEGISVETEKEFSDFQSKIKFILKQYTSEKFSYEKYSFPAIEIIACRYYNCVPRVKTEVYE